MRRSLLFKPDSHRPYDYLAPGVVYALVYARMSPDVSTAAVAPRSYRVWMIFENMWVGALLVISIFLGIR
jgi:hypothetical protein